MQCLFCGRFGFVGSVLGRGDQYGAVEFAETLLHKHRAARDHVNADFESRGIVEGSEIVQQLFKMLPRLCLADPTFALEAEFFKAMEGEYGNRVMLKKLAVLFPKATEAKPPTDVLKSLRELQGSRLYAFTGGATQNAIKAATTAVENIVDGVRPSFTSSEGGFEANVKAACAFFCRIVPKGEAPELVGAPAAEAMAREVLEKGENCTLEDLKDPFCFSFLLPEELSVQVLDLKKAVFRRVKAELHAPTRAKGKKSGQRKCRGCCCRGIGWPKGQKTQ
jgi:hypothetical protein